jgi:hypothetical protein
MPTDAAARILRRLARDSANESSNPEPLSRFSGRGGRTGRRERRPPRREQEAGRWRSSSPREETRGARGPQRRGRGRKLRSGRSGEASGCPPAAARRSEPPAPSRRAADTGVPVWDESPPSAGTWKHNPDDPLELNPPGPPGARVGEEHLLGYPQTTIRCCPEKWPFGRWEVAGRRIDVTSDRGHTRACS